MVYGSSDENYNDTKILVDVFLNKGVDGLIVVPSDGSEKIIEELHENNIPLVLVDRYYPNLDVSFSCLNNYKATQLATQHLVALGYKSISLIAYKSDMSNVIDRIAGYEDSIKQAGLYNFAIVKQVNMSNTKLEIGKAIDNLINKKKAKAIIFTTNALTIYGLYCLKE